MSIETKKIVCEPFEETDLINHYSAFGWELSHRDEVYSETEHIDGARSYSLALTDSLSLGKTDVSTSTSVTNYVNLIFQRSTLMGHYEELAQKDQICENDFAEIDKVIDDRKTLANNVYNNTDSGKVLAIKIFIGVGLLLSIGGFVGCFAAKGVGAPLFIALMVIGTALFLVGCCIGIYLSVTKHSDKAYKSIMDSPKFKTRLEEIKAEIARLESEGNAIIDQDKKAKKQLETTPALAVTGATDVESKPRTEEIAPVREAASADEIVKSIRKAIAAGQIDLASGKCVRAHEKGLISDEKYLELKKEIDELDDIG